MPDAFNSLSTKPNRRSRNYLIGFLLLGFGALSIGGCDSAPSPTSSDLIPHTPSADLPTMPPSPMVLAPKPKPSYVRPTTAENGQPFPTTSGYIKKYLQKATNGLSSLMIKNDQNNSDVYVKVFDLSKSKAKPVRFFLVRAHESFTAKEITPGKYDVRYRDLDSGGTSKSEEFQLTETTEGDSTKYSDLTMTLYKVPNGNMHTETIDDEAFE